MKGLIYRALLAPAEGFEFVQRDFFGDSNASDGVFARRLFDDIALFGHQEGVKSLLNCGKRSQNCSSDFLQEGWWRNSW